MLNWIIRLLSNTIGQWHFPWVDKRFPLKDYFEIEKRLRELNVPFAVGCVTTHGHGSNILIRIGQYFSSKREYTQITHALAHIGLYNGFKHRVVEAIGDGIREVSLLESIGQRDIVVIRVPNKKLMNDQICKYAIEYLKDLADRDRIKNIAYDNDHNYNNADTLDCSETILQSLRYAYKKADHGTLPVQMVNRAGKETWTPAEVLGSEMFVTIYDSREGFIDGNLQ